MIVGEEGEMDRRGRRLSMRENLVGLGNWG